MTQLVSERIKAAFLDLEASQQEAAALEQRRREETTARRREFEAAATDKIVPGLRIVAQTIQSLGYYAVIPSAPPFSESGCTLEFCPESPPLPAWRTAYSFSFRLRQEDSIAVIHSDPKNGFTLQTKIAPSIKAITTEWVEQETVKFVEEVLRVWQERTRFFPH